MIRQTILFRVSLSVLMLMTQCSAFCQLTIAYGSPQSIMPTNASFFEVEKSVLAGRFESGGYAYIKEHGLLLVETDAGGIHFHSIADHGRMRKRLPTMWCANEFLENITPEGLLKIVSLDTISMGNEIQKYHGKTAARWRINAKRKDLSNVTRYIGKAGIRMSLTAAKDCADVHSCIRGCMKERPRNGKSRKRIQTNRRECEENAE